MPINDGWISLVIAGSLIVLFFIVGFYWIFQKVIISEKGIKVLLLNRVLKECTWEEVGSIEKAVYWRFPAVRVKLTNGKEIHLDRRKCIERAIEHYSNMRIKSIDEVDEPWIA